MLLDRKVLAVVNAASTDGIRLALNGVQIESDGSAIATDGTILVKFTPGPGHQLDAKEFPVIDGVDPTDINKADMPEELRPFTLSSDAVQQVARALPKSKKRRYLPVLDTIALDVVQTNANGYAVMAVTDLETTQVFKPKKVDYDFPDYNGLIPESGKGKIKIGFKVEVLEKMLKTLKSLDVRLFSIEIKDAESACRIEAKTSDADEVLAVIMPCRV